MAPIKVAVVGAGVIGLTTAVNAINNLPHLKFTLLANKFSPNTTGDWSSGSISPYLAGEDLPKETMERWFGESWKYFTGICQSKDGGLCGIGFLPLFILYNNMENKPLHLKQLPGFRDLTTDEVKLHSPSGKYRYGTFATTVFVECRKFLPYLLEKFQQSGGIVEERHVDKLSDLYDEFDIVVNCTGLGAAKVVPDKAVIPISGHLIRVRAPWVKVSVQAGEFYVIPNSDWVILGGTRKKGESDTEPGPEDSKRIWNGCCALVPSLEKAEIVNEWVGLRPSRSRPRLEEEELITAKGRTVKIIHNYGHGGSGVTLSWGCAVDAVNLLKQAAESFNR